MLYATLYNNYIVLMKIRCFDENYVGLKKNILS